MFTMEPSTPTVRIEHEAEAPRGWTFTANVASAESTRTIELRLDWSDYEYWSGGRLTPTEVAECALMCALERLPLSEIPARTDASLLRRHIADFDELLTQRLPR
jgi:hypothetical protein